MNFINSYSWKKKGGKVFENIYIYYNLLELKLPLYFRVNSTIRSIIKLRLFESFHHNLNVRVSFWDLNSTKIWVISQEKRRRHFQSDKQPNLQLENVWTEEYLLILSIKLEFLMILKIYFQNTLHVSPY